MAGAGTAVSFSGLAESANLIEKGSALYNLGFGAFLTVICICLMVSNVMQYRDNLAASKKRHEERDKQEVILLDLLTKTVACMERHEELTRDHNAQRSAVTKALNNMARAVRWCEYLHKEKAGRVTLPIHASMPNDGEDE